jgi:hypothetical protein
MPGMSNPYFVRNTKEHRSAAHWEDMLNPDLRKKILKFADRKLKYKFYRGGAVPLPSELVPPENLQLYHESIKEMETDDDSSESEEESNNSPEPQPIFWVDVIQKLVFNRRNNGILGPLTVRFSDIVDKEWWGFNEDGAEALEIDEGTLALHKEPISAALDYDATWTGISKIRLVPLPNVLNERHGYEILQGDVLIPNVPNGFYRYELLQEAHDGERESVHKPPADRFYVADMPDVVGNITKNTLTKDLVEKLHLQHTVVNGVDEFSV